MTDPLRRFFVPPGSLRARHVTLGPDMAHRLGRVLRLRAGDRVILTEGGIHEYEVQITAVSGNALTANVVAERPPPPEPEVEITLYQSLIRANRFDLALEKGTEIGVARFVPLVTARSLSQENADARGAEPSATRADRWRRLITEAAEQCGRGRLPVVEQPRQFEEALSTAPGIKLLPWEGAADQTGGSGRIPSISTYVASVAERVRRVSVFIGPEGGFEPDEVELARSAGCALVSLGPRVLRSETAGIVACTLILAALGELGA
jgi:16S rRNA (uracil1498-N3)-methyltransferase